MGEKIWYLGSTKKTLGPMDSSRVRLYIDKGKTSAKTRVKREGEEFRLLSEEPYFRQSLRASKVTEEEVELDSNISDVANQPETDRNAETYVNREALTVEQVYGSPVDEVASEVEDSPEEKAKPTKKAPKAAKKRARSSTPKSSDEGEPAGFLGRWLGGAPPINYAQPYRLEKSDLWKSFSLGLDSARCKIAYMGLIVSLILGAVFGGITFGAMYIHPIVGLVFAFIAMAVQLATLNFALGALSYHSRCRLSDEETPGVKEALGYAWSNVTTLAAVPFVMTLLPLIPILMLAVAALISKIPYAGPAITGLVFILHIFLSVIAFICSLAGGLSWVLCPIIVGFERTGVKETMQILFHFARTSLARFFFKGFWPNLGMSGFSFFVLFVGACVLAPTMIIPTFGFSVPGTPHMIGMFFAGIWVSLFSLLLIAIILSTQNELLCRLYIAVRPSNDDLISKEAYLLRQA
ncbi:MAG: hypothetical protein P1V97_36095 [Planctomycetota bacterium]|nr:hypothetical protein [Planctomycetota bacterium]